MKENIKQNAPTVQEGMVGENIAAGNANWTFGGTVAKTFDEHVSRSVPMYATGHDLCAKVSDYFLSNGSNCFEIGCSTGTLTHALAKRAASRDVRFIGIDPEESMIEEARKKNAQMPNVEFIVGNVVEDDIPACDLILSYYTIQFIKPKSRQDVFNKIYNALNWGGGLLLFEKVRAPDARFQDMTTSIYTDFKLDQGYDTDQIVHKARSLKGILEPFSTQANLDLLQRAGFKDVMTIFKYVCFEGFLAIK